MIDIKVKLNKKTRQVTLPTDFIGVSRENLQAKLVFEFEDEFVDGTAYVEMKVRENRYLCETDKVENSYELPIKSVLLQGQQIKFNLRIVEGTDEENIPIWKSKTCYMKVAESINATEEQPETYPEWIESASIKLNQIDEALRQTDNLDVDVSKSGNVSTVEITKKDGSKKQVEILDGEPGSTDYREMLNKPSINNVILDGNKTLEELGIQSKGQYVQDSNYVHTDNNFTTPEKTKLSGLQNYNDTEIRQEISSLDTEVDRLTGNVNNIASDVSKAKTDILGKQNKLTAGKNITILDDVISSLGGAGVDITYDGTDEALVIDTTSSGSGSGGSGSTGGTSDYPELINKPKVNGVELVGDKTLDELGIQAKGTYLTEHQDISGKVDKVEGKQLSTNDFTDDYKNKLDALYNDYLSALTLV